MEHFAFRDAMLQAAVDYTANLKGAKRDKALFDYLCGACNSAFVLDQIGHPVPPWLFVIGCRGGSRLAEIERMLHAG